jgi:hypothetical protein
VRDSGAFFLYNNSEMAALVTTIQLAAVRVGD